jgi:hypothetical protein
VTVYDFEREARAQQAAADDLFDQRLAARIVAEHVRLLIRHFRDNPMFDFRADHFGQDLYRLFGPAEGFNLYDDWRFLVDEDEDEAASQAAWPSFDRPYRPGDLLVIDLADEAIRDGWVAPPELFTAVGSLRDAVAERRAERNALEELAWQVTADREHEAYLADVETFKAKLAKIDLAPLSPDLQKLLALIKEHPGFVIEREMTDIVEIVDGLTWSREIAELEELVSLRCIALDAEIHRGTTMPDLH